MRPKNAASWLAVALTVTFSAASSVAGAEDAPKTDVEDSPPDAPKKPAEEPSDGDDAPAEEPAEGDDAPAESDEKASEDDDEASEPADAEPSDGDDAEADDDEENPPVARDDEPLVLLQSDGVLRIKPRRARLRESAYTRLHAIAEHYREATGKKLVVTGGGRKPGLQATLMYDMMADGKNLLHLYVQVALVRPLIKTFEEGKEKRWGRRRTVNAMTGIIEEQVKKGLYVSRHLAHTAADVRSRGLSDEHVEALKEAVSAVKGARLVDERNGNAPHFHLSL